MRNFTVIHADDHLVVVHKEAGLLSVPAYDDECLVDLLEAELDKESFGRHRLAVVHRLDRQTSGLMVFARSPMVAAQLAKQFAAHSVDREYIAIVHGQLADERGTISAPLDGRRAVTHFVVLSRQADATTISVHLETGRRNQIRRHFADLGHPLIGDSRFAPELVPHPAWPHERLALHARLLGFWHPTAKTRVKYESPLPAPFAAFAQRDPQGSNALLNQKVQIIQAATKTIPPIAIQV